MKRYLVFIGLIFLSVCTVSGQDVEELTLQQCYDLASENYPMVQQYDLLKATADYHIDNASKGILPKVSINGQATYQSDVTGLPISIPNMEIPTIKKDQYKLFADIHQPLTDAAIIKKQKELIRLQSTIERKSVDVELYKLRTRIDQLYFGILLIDEQSKLLNVLMADIQNGIEKNAAAIKNGVAYKNSADLLAAEVLAVEQKSIALDASRAAYARMLSVFLGIELGHNITLEMPMALVNRDDLQRPELELFKAQSELSKIHHDLIDATLSPRVSLFLQTGMGRPALNFFDPDFSFYYLGGLRLNWNLANFYTNKNDRQLISLEDQKIQVKKSVFNFNTRIQASQQEGEIEKFEKLIEGDQRIVELRTKIKTSASRQLENGVISAHDYLKYVTAEDQAKQDLNVHKTKLLMVQYQRQTTLGNKSIQK